MTKQELKPFFCSECEDIFMSIGYDNPVFLADKVADCPSCGRKCWLHYETAYKELIRRGIMTKQERRYEMYCKLKDNFYFWNDFDDAEKVADFILEQQAKAVAEVVAPLEEAQPVAKVFGRYDDLWKAQCEALSKSREYTGG